MGIRDMPGPAKVFLGMAAWGIILWVFTLGNPSFVPVAKFLFIVLVLPNGIVEWLRDKNLFSAPVSFYARLALMAGAAVFWYFFYR